MGAIKTHSAEMSLNVKPLVKGFMFIAYLEHGSRLAGRKRMIRHIPLVVASEKGSTKEHGDALRTRACEWLKTPWNGHGRL